MTSQLQESSDEQKPPRGIKKIIVITLVILVLIGLGSAAGGYYYVQTQLEPVSSTGETVKVEIPQGSTVGKIGLILEQSDLIRDASIFRWYVRYLNNGNQFQAGTYSIQHGSTIDEIISKLVQGDVVRDTITFTIPEGWNVKQIAERLSEQGLVDKAKFLTEVNEGSFDYEWMQDIPQDKGTAYRLEGFLFPETYEIDRGSTEHEIIGKMLSQFDREWKNEWREELKKRGISTYDAITLASIIEREVVVDKERPLVAGIFYNRLNDGWMLQSCATVQFVLGKQRDRITFKDLAVESPYNTYIHEGLPPSPIANPGRASLAAVVYPEQSEYYFFVTKKDGSQEHHFAKTFAEHLKNDANSRGNW
jgi:UPF0755 protein